MANSSATLDRTFSALADPTRRAIVERLQRGPASVSELAAPHPMALPSFLKHLTVLADAGLVASRKRGRVRECELVVEALDETADWIEARRRVWTTRLRNLDAALTPTKEENR